MDMEKEYNDSEMSEFNSGIATLMRINEIKKWLAAVTIDGNLMSYLKHIKMYYKELYPMMTTEKELHEKKWKQVRTIETKLKKNEKLTPEESIFLKDLDNWELELRSMEQEKGMNLPRKTDARWAMAGGK